MSFTQPRASAHLELRALEGLPIIEAGDALDALITAALAASGIELEPSDVLVVTSKLVSRAEGRFVDLATVTPSARALELAERVAKDARVVELILRESELVSREAPGVLIVRHHGGIVSANAGIDSSNARPRDAGSSEAEWVLLLPSDPDAAARKLRAGLAERLGVSVGVVISDSLGRPFRLGSVGAAIGVAGLPALADRRGMRDLFDRELEHTITAFADEVAAAADLVAGQAGEGRGVVHVRGLSFPETASSATELARPVEQDLYVGPRTR